MYCIKFIYKNYSSYCIFFPSICIKIPLLDPDEYGESQQPSIVPAIYHKTLKPKSRIDRLEGSHEKDPEFISFLAAIEAPSVKPLSAEQQLEEIERATGAINDYNLFIFVLKKEKIVNVTQEIQNFAILAQGRVS